MQDGAFVRVVVDEGDPETSAYAVAALPEGGFVACGLVGGILSGEAWLLRADASGQSDGGRVYGASSCTAIARADNGNIFLAGGGYTGDAATFGGSPMDLFGGNDIVIAKLNPAGDVVAVRGLGTSNSEYPMAIAVGDGLVAFTGDTRGTLAVDGHSVPGGDAGAWVLHQ